MVNEQKCVFGNYSQILCFSSGCMEIPFICCPNKGICQCFNIHEQCVNKIHISSLPLMIESKRKMPTPQIAYQIDELVYLYSKMIKQMTQQYYNLMYLKQSFGFNAHLLQLIHILKIQQYGKLSGNYLDSIFNKNEVISSYNSIEFLLDSAKLQQISVELVNSLKNSYKFKQQFPQIQKNKVAELSMMIKIQSKSEQLKEIHINPVKDQYIECLPSSNIFIVERSEKRIHKNKNCKNLKSERFSKYRKVQEQEKVGPEFRFSEVLKGEKIKIFGKRAQQFKTDTQLTNTLVLLEPNLWEVTRSWKIKVVNDYVCFGICLKNKVMKQNFGFSDFATTKHGAYMIGNFGFVLSHSDESINNKFLSFQFKKNDVIKIKYDFLQGKLKFSKDKKPDDKFEMDIQGSGNDIYHPCVYLYQQGWAAEILN